MHESMFSYNLSRPYPYRWFTWVVFVGGAFAIVIFSLINFEAAGFELVVVHTTDTTVIESPDETSWYQRRPWSLASKMKSTCAAQTISVGSTYYTNNGAFPYTLTEIYTHSLNKSKSVRSQAYKNSPITDCVLQDMQVTANDPVAYFKDSTVNLNCSIQSSESLITLALQTELPLGSQGFQAYSKSSLPILYLLDDLNQTMPSLGWGRYLVGAYADVWIYFAQSYPHSNLSVELSWYADDPDDISASFTISEPLYATSEPDTNITLLQTYLNVSTWAFASFQDEAEDFDVTFEQPPNITFAKLNASDSLTPFALIFDAIGKSIYWMVLTDLGQNTTNMLADPERLMYYLKTTSEYLCPTGTNGTGSRYQFCYHPWKGYGNITSFYHDSGTGIPFVQPAVFAQEYTCQVPKIKAPGSLIISILVADLVFLQVLWKVLNWLTTLVLTRRNRHANHCPGCEEALLRSEEESIEMQHRTDSTEEAAHKSNADEPEQISDEFSGLIMAGDYDHARQLEESTSKHGQAILMRPISRQSDQ